MNLFKMLFVVLFAQLTFANPAPQLGAQPATQPPQAPASSSYMFVNNRSVFIRNDDLTNPREVPVNSRITLDPKFVLETFRTNAPTREQIQRLFMNPGEFYGRIDARTFTATDGRRYSEYFFPVQVQTPSGESRSGQMSLFTYNRMGYVELSNGAPLAAPPIPTQGGSAACTSCTVAPPSNLSDISAVLNRNSRTSVNPLWERYAEFARNFSRRHSPISKSQAGYYKRRYVKEMVDTFGAQDAGKILTAITGFAESPYRGTRELQMAETAGIIKVINNRANNHYRSRSRTLRDIGVLENADAHLVNVLADWQFSVWNERDNSLQRILNLNPDTADASTMHRLTSAFDSQHLMTSGQIQFLGRMNDPRLHHYHANYVAPVWASSRNRVDALIRVGSQSIDIGRQRGASHIFYAGVP